MSIILGSGLSINNVFMAILTDELVIGMFPEHKMQHYFNNMV